MRTKLEENEEGASPRKGRHGMQRKPEKNWERFSITKTKKVGKHFKNGRKEQSSAVENEGPY